MVGEGIALPHVGQQADSLKRLDIVLYYHSFSFLLRARIFTMSFKLTPDYIFGLLNDAAAGNLGSLTEALDPEVRWRIGSETKDDAAKTGIFVRAHTFF